MFADCIPVKGFLRSVIYDLGRRDYEFVPNSLIDFILLAQGKTEDEIIANYSNEDEETVLMYLNFLKEKEFGFWIEDHLSENFNEISLDWHSPAHISNSIIEISQEINYNLFDVIFQLEELGCRHLQMISYDILDLKKLESIINLIKRSSYKSIEIILKFDPILTMNELDSFIEGNKKIKSIIFHSSETNTIKNCIKDPSMGIIAHTKQQITPNSNFNNNTKEYFNVSVELFTEAQKYNSYFNRKVSIDKSGNIKNCITHKHYFGNVNINSIISIISTESFQKIWFASKDETDVCRDCEFRYMCVDSRFPEIKNDGSWFHKKKCNYDPYTAKWD